MLNCMILMSAVFSLVASDDIGLQVRSAAELRKEQITSARFKWTAVTTLYDPGSTKSKTLKADYSFEFATGGKRRFHCVGGQNVYGNVILNVDALWTDDGSGKWMSYNKPHEILEFPSGTIMQSTWGHKTLMPFYWHFDLSANSQALDYDNLSVIREQHVHNELDCLLLKEKSTDRPRRREIVVCPTMDFSVLKVTSFFANGELSSIFTISYEQDGETWIPTKWECLVYEHEELSTGIVSTINQRELNHKISEESFQISFPAGTIVNNQNDGTRYLQRESDKRWITESEIKAGASYEEIMATESGEAAKSKDATENEEAAIGFECSLWNSELVGFPERLGLLPLRGQHPGCAAKSGNCEKPGIEGNSLSASAPWTIQ